MSSGARQVIGDLGRNLGRVLGRIVGEARGVFADRRLWLPPAIAFTFMALAMLSPVACASRGKHGEPSDSVEAPYQVAPPAGAQSAVPAPDPLPSAPQGSRPMAPRASIATEPIIRVLLQSGSSVEFTLLASGHLGSTPVSPGIYVAQPSSDGRGISINGVACAADITLALDAAPGSDGARFAARLTPPIGKPQSLRFSGSPVLHLDRTGRVQLIELVPMETYLAGVLPTEMVPSWPLEALKAQAVAARSYASAHYLDRAASAWQLHWHYSVDMAYGGCPAKRYAGVHQALDATRGRVLEYHGSPVPALFHACSGGRTESAANLWPELRGADGGSATPAMPVVDDPSARGGAAALRMLETHWQWKVNVPLADITSGLADWTREHPESRLTFGTVLEVKPGQRFADSGRVATVSIRHRIGKKEFTTLLSAADFRMAVGPGLVRSTWWDRCVMAAGKGATGGTLVLAGRGFGHGVGLSQVSAWKMATDGDQAEAILARFYPGVAIVPSWP